VRNFHYDQHAGTGSQSVRDALGNAGISGEDCYIKAYTWHGCKRFSAIRNGYAIGPARTTFLVAVSDCKVKGTVPTHAYDCDAGERFSVEDAEARFNVSPP
jgi:hypothetical protein